METVDALAEALKKYTGTILLTSHDRHFVRRVADNVIEIKEQSATLYPANYDAYLHRVEQECDALAPAASRPQRSPKKQAEKEKQKRVRNVRRELASLERKITSRDQERETVQERLLATRDPLIAEKAHTELTQLEKEIRELEEQWLELEQQSQETASD